MKYIQNALLSETIFKTRKEGFKLWLVLFQSRELLTRNGTIEWFLFLDWWSVTSGKGGWEKSHK